MADPKERLQLTLDEGRILVLGLQILLGFQFNVVLQPAFEKLPGELQYLQIGGLGLILFALALLLSVPPYHQIVVGGELSTELNTFATRVMGPSLLPLAVALGIDLYIVTQKVVGRELGIIIGLGVGCVALFFWYGLEALRRTTPAHARDVRLAMDKDRRQANPGKELDEKIRHVMTEARMILPGAQALLGFETAAFLMQGFDSLPASAKYIHLASLLATALATILLMAPAAYHRIVEEGASTEHFFRVASNFVLSSMVPLAWGISGDVFVVIIKITQSTPLAIAGALGTLATFHAIWFGFALFRRKEREYRAAKEKITDTVESQS